MSEVTSNEREAFRQENIGRLCLRLYRHFNTRAVQLLRAHGHSALTLAHTALLINLGPEGARIVDLADRAGMTKQAMGRLVQDLEEVGYVRRTIDPGDRRATRVTFTPEGQRFLDDAVAIKGEIESEYAAVLGPEGLQSLRAALLALVSRVEVERSATDPATEATERGR